jgi:hypothetical protein
MAARNKTKAEEAIAKLKREGLGPGNGEVIWLELDLIDPRNAKTAAQEFMSKEKRLDVLSKPSYVIWMMRIVDERLALIQSIMLHCTGLQWSIP